MEYFLVGLGGACGSLARYSLGRVFSGRLKTGFPAATFLINITGAVLLGLVNGVKADHSMSLVLADGFLGAYTTFSTFMYEGFTLFEGNRRLNAFVYILGSLLLGTAGFAAGFCLGSLVCLKG